MLQGIERSESSRFHRDSEKSNARKTGERLPSPIGRKRDEGAGEGGTNKPPVPTSRDCPPYQGGQMSECNEQVSALLPVKIKGT